MKLGAYAVTHGLVALLALGLVPYMTGCQEKKSESPASSGGKKDSGGTDKDDDEDDDDGDEGGTDKTEGGKTDEGETEGGTTDGGETTFDLCKDGLKKKVTDFDAFVQDLCDGGKLKTLRGADNVFDGTTPKILKDKEQKGDTESSMRLYTSGLYDCKTSDYWSLIKVQFGHPDKYKTVYEYDADADMNNVQASDTQSSYEYSNDSGEGGRVAYKATTKFIVLKEGVAYVAATTETAKVETMKSLKGLIIVNKKSDGKTEVFTMSDQVYEHDSGQADTITSRAITSLQNEQKRAFNNAKKANQAAGLLSLHGD